MTRAPIKGMGTISPIGRNLIANRFSLQASNIGIKNTQFITSQDEITFPLEEVFFRTPKLQKQLTLAHSSAHFTGYTLGIAESINVIVILLVLNQGELYPSLNVETPAKSCETQHPISSYQADQSLQYTLCHSLGFDRNCSALIFSKV
ncbi:MAG: hypothetical protein AB8E82_15320 [Aureispira sp.]